MGTLRFYLALSVAFSHSAIYTGKTYLFDEHASVTIFFLISGFIITYVLSNKYKNQTLLFYKNRFLRIFVPFFLIMLFIETAYFIFGNTPRTYFILENNYSLFENILLFFSNIFLFGSNWVNVFDNNLHEALVIPQSWSLPIELFFYFLAPFLINAKIKKLLLFIFSISTYLILLSFNKIEIAKYLFFPNLYFFIIGIYSCRIMISYNLEHKLKFNNFLKKFKNKIYFFILLIIILLNYLGIKFDSSNMIILIFFNLFIAFILPIIFSITSNFTGKYKNIDNFFGKQSYYVYLSHVFVYLVIIKLNIKFFNEKITYLIFLIIFSYIFYKLIDPVEKKLRSYSK